MYRAVMGKGDIMVKVTLLGDSIRMGYGRLVPEMLGENYTVFQPEENCRFAKYTLRGLDLWRAGIEGSDIIHWNNGLWDITTCVDGNPFSDKGEYVKTMVRIGKILKERAKEVIFATTTAVNDEGNPYDKNFRIAEYNEAVIPELKKLGIRINDLYSVIYPKIDEFVSEDYLHMNEKGYETLARQVVKSIKEAEGVLHKE